MNQKAKNFNPPLTSSQKKVLFEVLDTMGFTELEKLKDETLVSLYNWYVSMPHKQRTDDEMIGIRLNHVHAMLAALSRSEVHVTISRSECLASIVKRLQATVGHLDQHTGGTK